MKKIIDKNRDIIRQQIFSARDSANSSLTNYSNFLTTIASISLGLSPLIAQIMISNQVIGLKSKILFICSLVCIFVSLFFGLVNIVLEKIFYENWMNIYSMILEKWNSVAAEEISIEEAEQYEDGIYSLNKTKSSIWPLIAQSILCFLGFAGLLVIVSIIVLG